MRSRGVSRYDSYHSWFTTITKYDKDFGKFDLSNLPKENCSKEIIEIVLIDEFKLFVKIEYNSQIYT